MNDQKQSRLFNINKCARCGRDHKQLSFQGFEVNPITDRDGITWNWWALCPVVHEPILLSVLTDEQSDQFLQRGSLPDPAEADKKIVILVMQEDGEGGTVIGAVSDYDRAERFLAEIANHYNAKEKNDWKFQLYKDNEGHPRLDGARDYPYYTIELKVDE